MGTKCRNPDIIADGFQLVEAAAHKLCRWRTIRAALLVAALSTTLVACAAQKKPEATYYYFSDLPGNGHSRAYEYPSDMTLGYTTYPGFGVLGPPVLH
jgi:hypothetical protein